MYRVEKSGVEISSKRNFSTPDFSTPDLSTLDFSTMNFPTLDFSTPDLWLKSPGLRSLGLRSLGLKSSWLKSLGLKSPWLESSWLKTVGLKGLGLKLGFEKSGVEMSFNLFSHHSNLNKREREKSTKSQPMRNLNRSRKLPQCVLLVKKKRMNYMLIILSVIETSLKYLISIKKSTLFKVTITVNLLGQYVLSDLYGVARTTLS